MYYFDYINENPRKNIENCISKLKINYKIIDSKQELLDNNLPSLFKFISFQCYINQNDVEIICFKKTIGRKRIIFNRVFIRPRTIDSQQTLFLLMGCIKKSSK